MIPHVNLREAELLTGGHSGEGDEPKRILRVLAGLGHLYPPLDLELEDIELDRLR